MKANLIILTIRLESMQFLKIIYNSYGKSELSKLRAAKLWFALLIVLPKSKEQKTKQGI
jgi:hypothetical protein